MTLFPNSSKALLTISSLFVSPGWQAAERARFAANDMRFEKHDARLKQLLDNQREALSLPQGSEIWDHYVLQLVSIGEQLDALALHTATYGADERQILWTLGRHLAPGLGRTWGFWCRDEPIMPEISGGSLWFLPHVDPERSERLILPVAVIARWWRSMLDGPIESIWQGEDSDPHRTFQYWLTGQATPEASTLEKWYADDRKFRYRSEIATPPETRVVRTLLLWARAIETGWKSLVTSLTPDVAPDEPDPMHNKALQIAELFRLAHQLTVAPATKDPVVADQMFLAAVPDWLARGDFRPLFPTSAGYLPAAEECAEWLSTQFRMMLPGAPLQDIFRNAAMDAPADPVAEPTIFAHRQQLAACVQAGYAAQRSNARDRAAKVEVALAHARANPRSADMEADIQHLAALDALSKGDFDAAREILDRGLELCSKGSFGPVRLEMARLRLALSVASEAFNQNRCEAAFRDFARSIHPDEAERWCIGRAPWAYSMRLAAVDLSQRFWDGGIRPYPGVVVERPLEKSAPIFTGFFNLLLSGADEAQIHDYLAEHRGILKPKLRDVRGDTFFTMTAKMVPDLVATMRAHPRVYGDEGISTHDLATRMRETHFRFVNLLPTDMLNARDYLGQTALMLAADRKDADLLRILIDHRVDLDAQDALGRTALHSAVKSNALDCFELLLDAGANPTLQTSEGKTPAIFAAEFGREQIFKRRLAQRTRPLAKEEIHAIRDIAVRNESAYKTARSAYRQLNIELGGRSAFKEIIAAVNEYA